MVPALAGFVVVSRLPWPDPAKLVSERETQFPVRSALVPSSRCLGQNDGSIRLEEPKERSAKGHGFFFDRRRKRGVVAQSQSGPYRGTYR